MTRRNGRTWHQVTAAPLDPELAQLLALLPEQDYDAMTPQAHRDSLLAMSAMLCGPVEDGVARADLTVERVPVRRYDGTSSTRVVYLHGGGWVSGDLVTHDTQCAALCLATGATVLAVDYRLAPEDPFPAGLEDALTVLRWALATGPVAVAGDSAGANLAAAACLVLRDEQLSPVAQLLLYPATDLRGLYATDGGHSSRVENSSGYLLDTAAMCWFASRYVTAAQADDPRASVLAAPDLSGLPPAVVATAQYDLLRDEGIAYVDALWAAGVDVAHHPGVGLVHGYASAVGLSRTAAREVAEVYESFRSFLDPAPTPPS